MRVMCIRVPEEWPLFAKIYNVTYPRVLDECTVVDQKRINGDGLPGYKLAEHSPDILYAAKNFAIIPEQDADAMQEAEKEGIVNLEKAVV
jgi:hypothetical protein